MSDDPKGNCDENPNPVKGISVPRVDDHKNEHIQEPSDADQSGPQKKEGGVVHKLVLSLRFVWSKPIPFLTLGLLICAFAQAVIYYCTMNQIRRQVDEAHKQVLVSEKQTSIMRESGAKNSKPTSTSILCPESPFFWIRTFSSGPSRILGRPPHIMSKP